MALALNNQFNLVMKKEKDLNKGKGQSLTGSGRMIFKLPILSSAFLLALLITGCAKEEAIPGKTRSLMATSSGTPISAPLAPLNLGSAGLYTVLAQSGITTTGATSIQGNIGVWPITGAAMTGFSNAMDNSGIFSTSGRVSGNLYGANYSGTTPGKLSQAIGDMQTAFTNANLLSSPLISSLPAAGNISGQSLTPGIYKYGSSLMVAGSGVTLNGGPNDVYVFQIGSSLTVAAGAVVTLTGGLNASNVYWIVGSAATFGANANFSGIILAKTAVTLNTGDVFTGRIFAQTAVTMIANTVNVPLPSTPTFGYGADIGWVTQMEAAGSKYYNNAGVNQDLYTVLQGKGINAIRLRVFVNPTDGWCNIADVITKAKRAQAAGMNIMIDFHYSDVWADPGHQTVPAAWASQTDMPTLGNTVYNYTYAALSLLKSNGITPTWVQTGNETNGGMIWPLGAIPSSYANFAWLINSGYNATKAVFPSALVIAHIANGYNDPKARTFFDNLKKYGGNWDVCGFSVYPSTAIPWASMNAQVLYTMQDMVARYGKKVIISEAGMSVSDAVNCNSFLTDLISKTQSVAGGQGVFYWEPEAYSNWQGYTMGAFDTNGQPTVAMNAFIH